MLPPKMSPPSACKNAARGLRGPVHSSKRRRCDRDVVCHVQATLQATTVATARVTTAPATTTMEATALLSNRAATAMTLAAATTTTTVSLILWPSLHACSAAHTVLHLACVFLGAIYPLPAAC